MCHGPLVPGYMLEMHMENAMLTRHVCPQQCLRASKRYSCT